MKKHTFVICAYKESPFLEECICSLIDQRAYSEISIATSTPNEIIEHLASKYNIPLFINTERGEITDDWNFAYSVARTRYVTIAHQDDVYFHNYAKVFLQEAKKQENFLIYFTDYGELRGEEFVDTSINLMIKRLLLFPLSFSCFQNRKWMRRRILSLGCPICCPSVTFDKQRLPDPPFVRGYASNEDWEAWETLSKKTGRFLYMPYIQVGHRIHEESATSLILGDNAREREDLSMFRKFWPAPIAKLLAKIYKLSERSNDLS